MSKDSAESRVYDLPQVARMLGMSRNSAYAAAGRGEIPVIKIGKLLRVPKAAFDKMFSEVTDS
ncbi:MAG TPA: helix-turn-helix domain-containing protein [Tardiphaga sp.]